MIDLEACVSGNYIMRLGIRRDFIGRHDVVRSLYTQKDRLDVIFDSSADAIQSKEQIVR